MTCGVVSHCVHLVGFLIVCWSVSWPIWASSTVAAFTLSPMKDALQQWRDLKRHHPVVRACFGSFECSHRARSGDFGLSVSLAHS